MRTRLAIVASVGLIVLAGPGLAQTPPKTPVLRPIDKPPFDPNVALSKANKARAARTASQNRYDELKARWEAGYVTQGKDTVPLAFDQPVQNIGVVSDDGKIDITFSFRNTSGQTVTIKQAKPACGCTVANLAKNIYEPGEAGEIKASYDPKNREGLEFKDVDVTLEGANFPNVKIGFLVDTRPRVSSDPKAMSLGEVRKGAPAKQSITIVGREPGFDVSSVTMANPSAPFTITRVERTEATEEGATEGAATTVTSVRFDVELRAGMPVGQYSTALAFHTSDPHRPTHSVPINAMVVGDVRTVPDKVFILGEAGSSFHREVRLDHRTAVPFKILGMHTEGLPPGFGVALDYAVKDTTGNPGEVTGYAIQIAGSLPTSGNATGRLIVLTDVPDQPRIEILLQGMVTGAKR
ncbi:MAG: DUF1573 domain-containing protein [Phycisphaerales bacterium]